MSETQDQLEQASRAVGAACRSLVRQVQDLIQQKGKERKVDYTALSTHQLKTREMEQQVEILQLRNQLDAAQARLSEMRKISYRED